MPVQGILAPRHLSPYPGLCAGAGSEAVQAREVEKSLFDIIMNCGVDIRRSYPLLTLKREQGFDCWLEKEDTVIL